MCVRGEGRRGSWEGGEMDEMAEENERPRQLKIRRKSERGRGETSERRQKGYEAKEEEVEGKVTELD